MARAIIALLVTASYGLLGFLDDYYKVTKRTSDGLSGRSRLLIEFGVAAFATWLTPTVPPAPERLSMTIC